MDGPDLAFIAHRLTGADGIGRPAAAQKGDVTRAEEAGEVFGHGLICGIWRVICVRSGAVGRSRRAAIRASASTFSGAQE